MLFGLGILAVLVLGFVVLYNSLVRLRVLVDNAWADIDVQLKRRHDLIPNLIETVKGYAAHERSTFEAVVEARNTAVAARGPRAQGEAERGLAAALGGLFALAESYPQLRATENFAELQGSLANIEEAVQSARRYYNAVVRDFNTRIAQVPWILVAGVLGYSAREFFQIADDAERAVPAVTF
ncbi:MAG: LemA family protein [Acidobacteriota bacterium]